MSKKPTGRPKKHGAFSLIVKAGGVPSHRAYLRAYLSETRAGLLKDLGADVSTAQKIIVDRVIAKVGISRMIEEYSQENGVFINGELAPVLKKSFLAYSNSLRLDLVVLGIERRAARAGDITAFAEAFDAQKAAAMKAQEDVILDAKEDVILEAQDVEKP